MEQILSEIIQKINPFDEFDINTDLLGEGILDSLSLMMFIEEMEEQLKVLIPEERVNLDDFYSIKTIIELVKSLK